jgi:hypothetical protein
MSYRGHSIRRTFPAGYFEAYAGGRFVKADTLAGVKAMIRDAVQSAKGLQI